MTKCDKAEYEEQAWRACKGAINALWHSQHSWCFREPVDEAKHGAPNYYAVIKDPQDLQTIKSRLESFKYKSPLEVDAAVRKMCENAFTYNAEEHDVYKAARSLLGHWNELWEGRNVPAYWAAAQDPAKRAALLPVSGRRAAAVAAAVAVAGASGGPAQPQQQPQEAQHQQQQAKQPKVVTHLKGPPNDNINIHMNNTNNKHGQQHQQQRERQSPPAPATAANGAEQQQQRAAATTATAAEPPQEERPISPPQEEQQPEQQVQGQRPGGERQEQQPPQATAAAAALSQLQGQGQQQSQQELRREVQSHPPTQQPAAVQAPVVASHPPQAAAQTQAQTQPPPPQLQQQQQRPRSSSLVNQNPQQQAHGGGRAAAGGRAAKRPAGQAAAYRHPPLTPYRILQFNPHLLSGRNAADNSPVPLLLSLLRAATWLPQLFIACGKLRAQMLGGRTSDPELLLVRCLCPECGSQALPGYMPLTHFHMHSRGAEGDAAGLDELVTPSGSDAEPEGGGAAAAYGGSGGRGRYGRSGSGPGSSRDQAVVRVADMESLKRRVWGALRCGVNLEQADEMPFLDMVRQRAEAAGGAGLVGRRVWVYHFSDFLPSPHKLYGTWQSASITSYNAESGEHELRYERDPSGPVELVQLAVNFLHFGDSAPTPGCRPWGPGGEVFNRHLTLSTLHTYFEAPAGEAAALGNQPAANLAGVHFPQGAHQHPHRDQQSNSGGGGGTVHWTSPPQSGGGRPSPYPLNAVAAAVAAAAAAAAAGPQQSAGHLRNVAARPPAAAAAAVLATVTPGGGTSNAIVIDSDDEAPGGAAAGPAAAAPLQQQPAIAPPQPSGGGGAGIASPFSHRQAAALASGMHPHPQPLPQPQQQPLELPLYYNTHGAPAPHMQHHPPQQQPYGPAAAAAAAQPTIVTTGSGSLPAGAGLGQVTTATRPGGSASGGGTCVPSAAVGPRLAAQPDTNPAMAAGAGPTPTKDLQLMQSIQPTLPDPKINLELDKRARQYALHTIMTPEQKAACEGAKGAGASHLFSQVLKVLMKDPVLDKRAAAIASEFKRSYLVRQQQQQAQRQQQPQAHSQEQANGAAAAKQQQQQLFVQQQQMHMLRQYHVFQQQMLSQHQQQHQQQQAVPAQAQAQQQQAQAYAAAGHSGGAGVAPGGYGGGSPGGGTLAAGVTVVAPAAYDMHPSVQMPFNVMAGRPGQPGAVVLPTGGGGGGGGASPKLPHPHPHHPHPHYPHHHPQGPVAPAAAYLPGPQPAGAGTAQAFGHLVASRLHAAPGASESADPQAKRQRVDGSAAGYAPPPPQPLHQHQHHPAAPGGGAAAAAPGAPQQPPPQQPQQQQQPPFVHQQSVSPISQAGAGTAAAASSGGRGSVSGGVCDEGGGGGAAPAAQAAANGGGSAGGGRFKPLPQQLDDIIDITRVLVGLMDEVPLSVEDARATRKALRQLQAAGKDKYIQMAYVTMCSAAKIADEEEIRDTFEDIRREAAKC